MWWRLQKLWWSLSLGNIKILLNRRQGGHLVTVRKEKKESVQDRSYQRTKMQKEIVIQRLREKGCRITKQRLMLLDIILEDDCSCCKEIYYRATKKNPHIGTATVYRMVNTLEKIGAINRKNMYKVICGEDCQMSGTCVVEFEDGTSCHLSAQKWNKVIKAGMEICGYNKNQKIMAVTVKE